MGMMTAYHWQGVGVASAHRQELYVCVLCELPESWTGGHRSLGHGNKSEEWVRVLERARVRVRARVCCRCDCDCQSLRIAQSLGWLSSLSRG